MLTVLSIDELLPEEIEKATEYLTDNAKKSPISDLFWYELPGEILTKEQKEHVNHLGPLKIAIEVGKSSVRFELLVRSESLTNVGGGELTRSQIDYILNYSSKLINYIKKVRLL
jgi:hypothetical protein